MKKILPILCVALIFMVVPLRSFAEYGQISGEYYHSYSFHLDYGDEFNELTFSSDVEDRRFALLVQESYPLGGPRIYSNKGDTLYNSVVTFISAPNPIPIPSSSFYDIAFDMFESDVPDLDFDPSTDEYAHHILYSTLAITQYLWGPEPSDAFGQSTNIPVFTSFRSLQEYLVYGSTEGVINPEDSIPPVITNSDEIPLPDIKFTFDNSKKGASILTLQQPLAFTIPQLHAQFNNNIYNIDGSQQRYYLGLSVGVYYPYNFHIYKDNLISIDSPYIDSSNMAYAFSYQNFTMGAGNDQLCPDSYAFSSVFEEYADQEDFWYDWVDNLENDTVYDNYPFKSDNYLEKLGLSVSPLICKYRVTAYYFTKVGNDYVIGPSQIWNISPQFPFTYAGVGDNPQPENVSPVNPSGPSTPSTDISIENYDFSTIQKLIANLKSFVGEFPLLLRDLFLYLPDWLVGLFYLTIAVLFVCILLNILRG